MYDNILQLLNNFPKIDIGTTYPIQWKGWKLNFSPLQMYLPKAYVNNTLHKTSMCNWLIWSILSTLQAFDNQCYSKKIFKVNKNCNHFVQENKYLFDYTVSTILYLY